MVRVVARILVCIDMTVEVEVGGGAQKCRISTRRLNGTTITSYLLFFFSLLLSPSLLVFSLVISLGGRNGLRGKKWGCSPSVKFSPEISPVQ